MELPFTAEQFFGVFRDYNLAVWPAPVVLEALAVLAFVLVLRPRPWSGAAVSATLALLWAWLALAYHLAFFAVINPLAYAFAAVSLAGALVFLWQGAWRRRLRFAWTGGGRSAVGAALVAFALLGYPLASAYAGHRYPFLPTFGLPCPTTLYTIGLLAFLVPPYPRAPFVVPLLWCGVGSQAAVLLDVPQDLALVAAGITAAVLAARANARAPRPFGPARAP